MPNSEQKLTEVFDELIEDAALDFMGTGDTASGNREEKRWRDRATALREKISELESNASLERAEARRETIEAVEEILLDRLSPVTWLNVSHALRAKLTPAPEAEKDKK